MEALVEFGKIVLPAGCVLYAVYLMVRLFIKKEFEHKLIDVKLKNTDIILPLRLQAYERICLFLERITLKNLVARLNIGEMSAAEFHQVLLHEIREEFSHNLSQQVYMSVAAWDTVKDAMEETVMVINECAGAVAPNERSIELAKSIMSKVIEKDNMLVSTALVFIKEEIQQNF